MLLFFVDFLRAVKRFVAEQTATPKSIDTRNNREVVGAADQSGTCHLQPPRDESPSSSWCTGPTALRSSLASFSMNGRRAVLGAGLRVNSFAKLVAFGFAMSLLCAGCGTGVTVIALVSPSISQVSPQVVTAGSPDVTVTVQGANFQSQSSLTVNGTAVPTTFVSSTTLAAKISGTTLAQPAVQQLQVRNSNGAASNQVPLTVTDAPGSPDDLAIRTTQLPNAQVGSPYSVTFTASGGTQPYSWSVSSGSLPPGLTLSSGGVLSGTPTATGTSTFTVKVVESGFFKQTKTASYSISVVAASTQPATVSITTSTLGSAQVGASYAASLSATGGTPSYTWSIASGSLPSGLALSSAGVVSGTPTASGSSTFTVSLKDSG